MIALYDACTPSSDTFTSTAFGKGSTTPDYSLCRVGKNCSTHQYTLPVNCFTSPDFGRFSMETYLYRASSFLSSLSLKSISDNRETPSFLHNHIIINFFGRFFSKYTEAVTTSLVQIYVILPEICAFIVGFSCTVCITMKSLRAH